MLSRTFIVITPLLACADAIAQSSAAGTATQRDVNRQQPRIGNALKGGVLSVKEAGKLEKEESRVGRLQVRDQKDGKLAPAERTQLKAVQNQVSRDMRSCWAAVGRG